MPEREREVVVSDLDDKALDSVSVQANTSVSAVDRELELVVTRKELWSHYRMSFRVSHSLLARMKRSNNSPVYYNGDDGVGSLVSNTLVPESLIVGGSIIMSHPP